MENGSFRYDVFSLLPLDFLYLRYGVEYTILRFPRLLKFGDFLEFFTRLGLSIYQRKTSIKNKRISDASTSRLQYALRLLKTVIHMLYLIHLNACAYFAISAYEGLGSNSFVYDGAGNSYFRCFYFATKTATSIGKFLAEVCNIYKTLLAELNCRKWKVQH